jgi:hypothetical protein
MDWMEVGLTALTALTPVITMILVWGFKLIWNKIPASIVLVATPIFGALVNFGLLWIQGHAGSFHPLVGAALGVLAIALREVITSLQTKGLTGSVSQTNRML